MARSPWEMPEHSTLENILPWGRGLKSVLIPHLSTDGDVNIFITHYNTLLFIVYNILSLPLELWIAVHKPSKCCRCFPHPTKIFHWRRRCTRIGAGSRWCGHVPNLLHWGQLSAMMSCSVRWAASLWLQPGLSRKIRRHATDKGNSVPMCCHPAKSFWLSKLLLWLPARAPWQQSSALCAQKLLSKTGTVEPACTQRFALSHN